MAAELLRRRREAAINGPYVFPGRYGDEAAPYRLEPYPQGGRPSRGCPDSDLRHSWSGIRTLAMRGDRDTRTNCSSLAYQRLWIDVVPSLAMCRASLSLPQCRGVGCQYLAHASGDASELRLAS